MQPGSQDPRIESMFRADRLFAWCAVLVLWATYLFVFYEVSGSGQSGVVTTLLVAGGLVLLFNTAAIAAMFRHYAEDKAHIYGLDIHYLDEMRKGRR